MDELRKVRSIVAAFASEALGKLEKGKAVGERELIFLALYLILRRLEELEEEQRNTLNAFHRLDELVDVVKELKAAVKKLAGEGQMT
ncbi:conserved hypothetical protein [Pyrobaculum islandicum DSM 4184]|uniref:Uncharacterized protein n=1 Tax=Pyrobaculum islandicum (strain DSM 4184 / JCM 9189 / GEO3) TaxID=384616 RepID=A1RUD7_PYRIL|nr:hypothetical protein [Pyrobaculum islandicum]ABL88569.1 conserved hypothetical protein [Pyrobaculum islandicum DSM 4184]